MNKVTYSIKDGQFFCICNITDLPTKQQMESMMGGHSIIRNSGYPNCTYYGPEQEVPYFVGIFKMYGFQIEKV